MRRITSFFVLLTFVASCIMPPQGLAQSLTAVGMMPQPGTMVGLTPAFTPPHLRGMVIHPNDPFKFDFLVFRGDEELSGDQKQVEYAKLIKYFLASLAIPDEDQWVNLSPYEKDRIIPDNYGLTEMGRDVLAQDYMLKQISASLTNPDTDLGKKFWDSVYEKAHAQFGTTNIPTDTFNKVWIVPDKAVIFEKGNTVVVLEHHLKVMLESDYLAAGKQGAGSGEQGMNGAADDSSNSSMLHAPSSELTKQIMREVIVPAIEKEVNEGKNFAPLRQIHNSMLLAAWYKRALKESILAKVYGDKAHVKGIDQDPKANQAIYDQYVSAFKKGVFSMIKEDVDRFSQETIPRKYFSGGDLAMGQVYDKVVSKAPDNARTKEEAGSIAGNSDLAMAALKPAAPFDAAMTASVSRRMGIGEIYYRLVATAAAAVFVTQVIVPSVIKGQIDFTALLGYGIVSAITAFVAMDLANSSARARMAKPDAARSAAGSRRMGIGEIYYRLVATAAAAVFVTQVIVPSVIKGQIDFTALLGYGIVSAITAFVAMDLANSAARARKAESDSAMTVSFNGNSFSSQRVLETITAIQNRLLTVVTGTGSVLNPSSRSGSEHFLLASFPGKTSLSMNDETGFWTIDGNNREEVSRLGQWLGSVESFIQNKGRSIAPETGEGYEITIDAAMTAGDLIRPILDDLNNFDVNVAWAERALPVADRVTEENPYRLEVMVRELRSMVSSDPNRGRTKQEVAYATIASQLEEKAEDQWAKKRSAAQVTLTDRRFNTIIDGLLKIKSIRDAEKRRREVSALLRDLTSTDRLDIEAGYAKKSGETVSETRAARPFQVIDVIVNLNQAAWEVDQNSFRRAEREKLRLADPAMTVREQVQPILDVIERVPAALPLDNGVAVALASVRETNPVILEIMASALGSKSLDTIHPLRRKFIPAIATELASRASRQWAEVIGTVKRTVSDGEINHRVAELRNIAIGPDMQSAVEEVLTRRPTEGYPQPTSPTVSVADLYEMLRVYGEGTGQSPAVTRMIANVYQQYWRRIQDEVRVKEKARLGIADAAMTEEQIKEASESVPGRVLDSRSKANAKREEDGAISYSTGIVVAGARGEIGQTPEAALGLVRSHLKKDYITPVLSEMEVKASDANVNEVLGALDITVVTSPVAYGGFEQGQTYEARIKVRDAAMNAAHARRQAKDMLAEGSPLRAALIALGRNDGSSEAVQDALEDLLLTLGTHQVRDWGRVIPDTNSKKEDVMPGDQANYDVMAEIIDLWSKPDGRKQLTLEDIADDGGTTLKSVVGQLGITGEQWQRVYNAYIQAGRYWINTIVPDFEREFGVENVRLATKALQMIAHRDSYFIYSRTISEQDRLSAAIAAELVRNSGRLAPWGPAGTVARALKLPVGLTPELLADYFSVITDQDVGPPEDDGDFAMNKTPTGGIDFAQSNLDMQIRRDGNGVPLPVSQQNLDGIRIDGLVPVILDIRPAAGVPLFSEAAAQGASAA